MKGTRSKSTGHAETPLADLGLEEELELLDAEFKYVLANVVYEAPTTVQPGTIGKAAILHGRAQRGLPLFHPDDAVEKLH